MERDKLIISKGYDLITMWENDYRKSRKNLLKVENI